MFGHYPVINKSDTFFEFYYEAFLWSFLLHPFIWLLVFIAIFKSKFIIRIFHRKIIAYSLLIFIPIFFISLCVISIYLNKKLSDSLLYGTIFIIPIITFCVVMFIQSSRFKEVYEYNKVSLVYKFKGIPSIYQIIFLIMVYILFFSFTFENKFAIFPYHFSLAVLPFFLIFTFMIYKKMSKVTTVKIPFKPSDYMPMLIIALILISISFVSVGDFICIVPKLNCYFSCGICK